MPDTSSVELRGEASRDVADMLDAISTHRRISRWALVVEILEQWSEDKQREVIAVARVTGVLNDRRTK